MAGRRRSPRVQQGGSAWTGSIQQELIEKLWVAILTFDSSSSSSAEASSQPEAKREETESDDSSESDEDDEDVDLSDGDGGYALVNRCDLFSVAARQMQENEEKAALDSKNDNTEQNLNKIKTQAETTMSTSLQVDEKIDRPLSRPISLSLRNVSSKPSKIPQLSPLSPTISLTVGGGATASGSGDVFSPKGHSLTTMVPSKKFTSKIPLSPSLRRKMLQPRERLASDPTPKRLTVKAQSNDIAARSRRSLTPDPKPFKQRPRAINTHKAVDMAGTTGGRENGCKISRTGTDWSKNKSSKADGYKIDSLNISRNSFKGKIESDKNSKIKQASEGGSTSDAQKPVQEAKSRVPDIPKRTAMGNSSKFAQESKREERSKGNLGSGNAPGIFQVHGTAKIASANKEEHLKDRDLSRMKNAKESSSPLCKGSIKEKNKSVQPGDNTKTNYVNKTSTQLRWREQRLSPKPSERRLPTKLCRDENDTPVKRHSEMNAQQPRQTFNRNEKQQRTYAKNTPGSQPRQRSRQQCTSSEQKTGSRRTTDPPEKETGSSCAASSGNSEEECMKPSCLENCLKEAILGVLQGLPEGWILVGPLS